MADDTHHDPTRRSYQPKADPSKDAPVTYVPRSLTAHEALAADFARQGLKSSLEHGCFNCGQPGSTFPCCNEVICDACATWFYPPDGHTLADHLKPQPVPEETEMQRLQREHFALLQQVHGTPEEQLRRKIATLREKLTPAEKS